MLLHASWLSLHLYVGFSSGKHNPNTLPQETRAPKKRKNVFQTQEKAARVLAGTSLFRRSQTCVTRTPATSAPRENKNRARRYTCCGNLPLGVIEDAHAPILWTECHRCAVSQHMIAAQYMRFQRADHLGSHSDIPVPQCSRAQSPLPTLVNHMYITACTI
jgi:hypothetical protein